MRRAVQKGTHPAKSFLLWGMLPLAVVLVAALLWYPPLWGSLGTVESVVPFAAVAQGDLVNINTAPVASLTALPGIGEVKAQAIVAYRDENGAFTQLDQLLNVPGIGPSTLEGLRDRVCFE